MLENLENLVLSCLVLSVDGHTCPTMTTEKLLGVEHTVRKKPEGQVVQQLREDSATDKAGKLGKLPVGIQTKERLAGGAVVPTLAYGCENRMPRREEIQRCRQALLRACWSNTARGKNCLLYTSPSPRD